jgi:hypothetical protein
VTTQEAFQDAAYWRARAKQLESGINRALKERTSLDPEQYANRVWSHLHNVVNAPVGYQRTPVDTAADERDWMSRE